ncbi:MAG TPA: hypothetical protein VFD47_12250 [Actinomycetota bacterium]|nr:hypothetical protein [Actinomycetota bacterium]
MRRHPLLIATAVIALLAAGREPDQAVGWEPSDELRITPTEVEDFESRPWAVGDPIPQAYRTCRARRSSISLATW